MSIFDLQATVVADIDAEFGFSSIITNRPLISIEAAQDRKVYVAKGMVGPSKLLNKAHSEDLLRIQIGILEKADIDDIASQDAVILIGENVRKFYQARSLTGSESDYKFHEVISTALYDYDSLDDDGFILAVVTITFKEWVANGS